MDIGRAFFNRFAQHSVDEFDDRRIIFTVEQVLGVGQFFCQREQVTLVAEIFH